MAVRRPPALRLRQTNPISPVSRVARPRVPRAGGPQSDGGRPFLPFRRRRPRGLPRIQPVRLHLCDTRDDDSLRISHLPVTIRNLSPSGPQWFLHHKTSLGSILFPQFPQYLRPPAPLSCGVPRTPILPGHARGGVASTVRIRSLPLLHFGMGPARFERVRPELTWRWRIWYNQRCGGCPLRAGD